LYAREVLSNSIRRQADAGVEIGFGVIPALGPLTVMVFHVVDVYLARTEQGIGVVHARMAQLSGEARQNDQGNYAARNRQHHRPQSSARQRRCVFLIVHTRRCSGMQLHL
jgi:hypothetical protein